MNGRLYLIGGFDGAGNDVSTVFSFDGRRWSTGPRLPIALDHPAAAVAGGRLFVVGGFANGYASDRCFELSRSGRSWTEIARLQHARGAHALVGVGKELFVLGGKDGAGVEITSGEVLRAGARGWSNLSTIPLPRDHLAGFAYGGFACAAGGRSPNTGRVDCYDTRRSTWRHMPSLPIPTSGAGAATMGGTIFVGGGELAAEGGTVIAQLAHFSGGRWYTGHMLLPRHGIQFAIFRGRIWVCGGAVAPGLHPVAACTSIR